MITSEQLIEKNKKYIIYELCTDLLFKRIVFRQVFLYFTEILNV